MLVNQSHYNATTAPYACEFPIEPGTAAMNTNILLYAEDDVSATVGMVDGGIDENVVNILMNSWSFIRGNGTDIMLSLVGDEITANEHLKNDVGHGQAWPYLQKNPNLMYGSGVKIEEWNDNVEAAFIHLMYGG